ncbi:MAG: hypothetical protein ACKVUT_13030 [Gaiella sp.]
MRRILRRPLALAAVAASTLVAAAGIAWAAIPEGNVVNACFDTTSGALRAVPVATDCVAGSESAVALGGPTRAYSFSRPEDVILGTTGVTVASLILPEGSYLLHGKVNVANLNTFPLVPTFVPCSLLNGTTAIDQSWVQLMSQAGAYAQSISLQGPVVVPAGGKLEIKLTCASLPRPGGPTTNVRARYRHLDAVQVDALQVS